MSTSIGSLTACIFNTGSGHWVSAMILGPDYIEYFDSAFPGAPPNECVVEQMKHSFVNFDQYSIRSHKVQNQHVPKATLDCLIHAQNNIAIGLLGCPKRDVPLSSNNRFLNAVTLTL